MRRLTRLHVVLLAVAAQLATPASARATTISITGLPGQPGTDGADGNSGAGGGTGGDGQAYVEAIADTPGENNTAIALGGAGGRGGAGGDALLANRPGGNGGTGGVGGAATARATGTGAASVVATAIAGYSAGGPGGSSVTPGMAGVTGVPGASINDSYAEAMLTTDLPSLATATATAGGVVVAPAPYRPGRNATALATVTNASGGASSSATARSSSDDRAGGQVADAVAQATGAGSGPVDAIAFAEGRVATADARGTTEGTGAVTVRATAGPVSLTDSGGGTATAYGSNAGSAPVHVTASASRWTNNPFLPIGGLSATAEGHSTGGADVIVEAILHNAILPNASLVDAVSGSTAGRLTLRQSINAVYKAPDVQGQAVTSLHATNPGGGAIAADVIARSGSTRDVVLGDILATSVTGADVAIDVLAIAGESGGEIVQENRGAGTPTPSRIYGQSNGGAVDVSVTFDTSNGYFLSGLPAGTPDHPDGFPAEMTNVAGGDTTGVLELEQTAIAGGGRGPIRFGGPGPPPGRGGDARSVLTKDTASSALELRPVARAGPGNETSPGGGDATAIAHGSNSAGSGRVFAKAVGGYGVLDSHAGDARVEVTASTTGDGHEVLIGAELPAQVLFGFDGPAAIGGRVTDCSICTSPPEHGDGGLAISTSTGTAHGDSAVTIFDSAVGGNGGGISALGGVFDARGGDGGAASSFANAEGAGTSAVRARSDARGGNAIGRMKYPGSGGDADATAIATGSGLVEAWAHAQGGESVGRSSPLANPGPVLGLGGSAVAHASADGASGFARAEALTGFGNHSQLRAQSEAQVGSQRDVAAGARTNAALASAPSQPGLEGIAFITSSPHASDVGAALTGNGALADLFAADGQMAMGALAQWQGDASDGPLNLSTDFEITISGSEASRKFVIGSFGVDVIGDGFGSLAFSLAKNGVALGSTQNFGTVDEVMAFFTNTLIDLGLGWKAGDKLLAHFDLALDAGTRFEMGLAYAVPEPGTGMLLVLGLVLFAIYRVTSKPAATRSHVA